MRNSQFYLPVFGALTVSLLLMGIAIMTGQAGSWGKLVTFYGVSGIHNSLLAGVFIALAIGAGIATKFEPLRQPLGYALAVFALIPVITLFSNLHWIDSLGGFPAIGSGQGVIKYFALLALAITLVPHSLSARSLRWINYFPVALVLLWIGGMKFTLLEAQGIEDLVKTSPLMSWMYQLMDVQQASNVIGVYDLVALVLLGVGIVYPKLLLPGIAMSGAVFATTQTFLLSFPGSLDGAILTGSGIFIIKDLWFIANLWVIYALRER